MKRLCRGREQEVVRETYSYVLSHFLRGKSQLNFKNYNQNASISDNDEIILNSISIQAK